MSVEPCSDRFGVPHSILGQHPDDFYGVIGRVACLSALLEYQVLTVYQTMTNSKQDQHRRLSASQLIEAARQESERIEDKGDRQVLSDYLRDVEAALQQRNDYIHSLWPAQQSMNLFGWRPSRAKDDAFDPLKPNETVETTLEELATFILSLVDLIDRRERAFGAARVEQDRRLRLGGAT